MRKILLKTAIAPILAILILGLLPLSVVHAATSIYLVPDNTVFDTSTGSIGTLFNVSVWVSGVDDMKTWQVKIGYDDTILYATRWFEPKTNSSYVFYGKTTLPVPAPPDPARGAGWVGFGSAMFPAPDVGNGFTGSGLLAIVEFNITDVPGKFETLYTDLVLNYPSDTFWIKAGESTKRAFDTYNDGSYTMTWVLPPHPRFALTPTSYANSPFVNVTGDIITVTAYIDNLDAAWDATGATFTLTWDPALLGVSSYAVDPLWSFFDVDDTTPGQLFVNVSSPTSTPNGDVNIIVIDFEILFQDTVPPRAPGYFDQTIITFTNYVLENHVQEIPTTTPGTCDVKIYALMTIPLGWLEVIDPADGDHEIVIGPEPSIGKEFEVQVIIKNMHTAWHMIGYQFRLCYDETLIEGLSIEFGPFMADPRWNRWGVLDISRFDPDTPSYDACAVVGQILWPDPADGRYKEPWAFAAGPNVTDANPPSPILATITFRVLEQLTAWPPINLYVDLELFDTLTGTKFFLGVDPATQVKSWIPFYDPINGQVVIMSTPAIGRVIDLYGGIEGENPFPAPFGGQGLNQPMDMVWPQKEVFLHVNVTYNFWPVQNKIVAYEVEGPNEFLFKGTAITGPDGHAVLSFRMPWECFDAELYFGVYTVTATVDVACVVINDTMQFHYDYLINIFKVTTDKFYYAHGEDVVVTIEYGSHARIPARYLAEFWTYISDELGQPIGYDVEANIEIGGAVFCQYKEYRLTLTIHIPKWAFAGYAKVHVNCFNKNPTEGGFAWCPEYTCDPPCPQSPEPYPTIYILPE